MMFQLLFLIFGKEGIVIMRQEGFYCQDLSGEFKNFQNASPKVLNFKAL